MPPRAEPTTAAGSQTTDTLSRRAASSPSPTPPTQAPRVANPRRRRWWKVAAWALAGALSVAVAVLVARWLVTLDGVRQFMVDYPGEYPLPEGTAPGFPAWVRWQHFFNLFLMALIIRTGLQVRTEQKPAAYWSPRAKADRKVSLTVWLHQSLDALWVINGAVFIVLLIVSGHWARIVPSSIEVFPNALSAALQYLSLDWPTEHGWANYNSLQQLAYFVTVFVAAPLSAATGLRMSLLWPASNARLNRLYPTEVARAIHFPVMLYFVSFIVMHVAMVFATGALRNLNHMFAGTDAINWVGFAWFIGAAAVIAAAWTLARPLIVAPVANVFGRVSNR